MPIGDRLRALREEEKRSQGDIEKRSGLIRCNISCVENGHTAPAIETPEKFARALEVTMYQLLCGGEESPALPNLAKRKTASVISDLLYGLKAIDITTVAIAAALLVVVALWAGLLPARRVDLNEHVVCEHRVRVVSLNLDRDHLSSPASEPRKSVESLQLKNGGLT